MSDPVANVQKSLATLEEQAARLLPWGGRDPIPAELQGLPATPRIEDLWLSLVVALRGEVARRIVLHRQALAALEAGEDPRKVIPRLCAAEEGTALVDRPLVDRLTAGLQWALGASSPEAWKVLLVLASPDIADETREAMEALRAGVELSAENPRAIMILVECPGFDLLKVGVLQYKAPREWAAVFVPFTLRMHEGGAVLQQTVDAADMQPARLAKGAIIAAVTDLIADRRVHVQYDSGYGRWRMRCGPVSAHIDGELWDETSERENREPLRAAMVAAADSGAAGVGVLEYARQDDGYETVVWRAQP